MKDISASLAVPHNTVRKKFIICKCVSWSILYKCISIYSLFCKYDIAAVTRKRIVDLLDE